MPGLMNKSLAQKAIKPLRITTEIKLDGKLDESEWANTPELNDFFQTYPNIGTAPSFKTFVKLLYNDNFLYVGIMAYDSLPQLLVGNTMERDLYNKSDDNVVLMLDTYHDKTNSITFSSNILGSRYDDETTFNGDNTNASFNTFWDVKTNITGLGYSAEFKIPFTSLRFQNRELMDMGLKIVRIIARKNETVIYPRCDTTLSNIAYRIDNAKTIVFEGLKSKKPFYITPYISANYSEQSKLNGTGTGYTKETELFKRNHFSKSTAFDKVISNVGIDLKYGLSKNFTLDATINTDFAQAEVENRVVSLNRFSVFLPEKRNFFLESQNYLSFNVSGDYNSGSNISLFNSRNIGIENEEKIPIIAGVRLTGKANGYQLGFLNMQTKGIESKSISPQNFAVFRVRKDLYKNGSFIGGMFTNRVSTTSKNDISNQSFGLDFYRKFNPKWALGINLANTNDKNAGKFGIKTGTYNIFLSKTVYLGYSLVSSLTYSGNNFLPLSGFASDAGFVDLIIYNDYSWKPKNKSKVAYYDLFNVIYNRYRLNQKLFDNGDYYLYASINYNNGAVIRSLFNYNKEYIPYDWNFSKNIILPKAYYNNNLVLLKYVSKTTRSFTYESKFGIGRLYNGKRIYTDPTFKIYLSKYFNLNVGTVLNFINFPKEYSTTGKTHYTNALLFSGITFTASPKLSLKLLAQYDNISRNFGVNGRFRYNSKEGTDLYIVYTPGFYFPDEIMTPKPPRLMSQSLIIKYSKTFNL